MRLAYLGLGIMGSAMAANIARAGVEIVVWNRTKGTDRERHAIASGAVAADTAQEAVRHADIVLTCLSDARDVQELILGREGIAVHCRPGTIIVDMATTGPDLARTLARELALMNIDFLDAPVTGGDVGARNATLTIMVGGSKEVFERALPVLEKVGRRIEYCGSAGSGQSVKLCNQILCSVNLIGVCEALTLAKELQLDLRQVVDTCNSGAAGSWSLANLGPRIISKDDSPGFMIKDILKDLRLVEESYPDMTDMLPGAELARKLFRKAISNIDSGGQLCGTQAMIHAYTSQDGA